MTKTERRLNLGFPESIFPIREEGLDVLHAAERRINTDWRHPESHAITGGVELCYLKPGQILSFEGYNAAFGRHDLSGRQVKIVDVYPGSAITPAWIQLEVQFGDPVI